MSKINKSQSTKISKPSDAVGQFAGTGKQLSENKMGSETETCFMKVKNGSVVLIEEQENKVIEKRLSEKGIKTSLEACYGVLETKTNAYHTDQVSALLEENDRIEKGITEAISGYAFRCPASFMPSMTLDEALQNSVSDERMQSLIQASQALYSKDALMHGMMTTAIHISMEYSDPEHLYDVMRRGAYLSPVMAMINDNSFSLFNETPQKGNKAFALRDSYNQSSGVQRYIFESKNPEDFIHRHIESLFEQPMLFYYDQNGQAVPAIDGRGKSYGQLVAMGLDSETNFALAESLKYHDMKLTNIRDGEGNAIGKRVEVRMASGGRHQHDTMTMFAKAAFADADTGQAIDSLLEDFGYSIKASLSDYERLMQDRETVKHHGNRFMDIPFGNGTMRDFSSNMADIILNHYKGSKDQERLNRFNTICQTGETDSKILYDAVGYDKEKIKTMIHDGIKSDAQGQPKTAMRLAV